MADMWLTVNVDLDLMSEHVNFILLKPFSLSTVLTGRVFIIFMIFLTFSEITLPSDSFYILRSYFTSVYETMKYLHNDRACH